MTPKPRYSAKVDLNQNEIVRALRAMGCTVTDLSAVGKGCPDILVGIFGTNILMEIKNGKGVITPEQAIWHKDWKGQFAVVRSIAEAIEVVNSTRVQRGVKG